MPWAKPWKTANTATMAQASHTGARQAAVIASPSTNTDTAIPSSIGGGGTPSIASNAPSAMTAGKITGSAAISGRPRNAPHSPTATIASK